MKIVNVKIDDLIASEYNPRKWSDDAITQLKESIKKFGLVDPILANNAANRKNIVIGGHFRLKIAKDLGYTEVPVYYVDIPDIEREKELNIRLNKNIGDWDLDLLKDFDPSLLSDIGFDSTELDDIFIEDIDKPINPFYYGEFQYSDDSGGKWFKGAHKPLISKELFETVQQTRGVNKGLWGTKQFPFRGLIICGRCGACMTAQEKFKKLKTSGEYVRYVYYCCSKNIKHECEEKYINENDLCRKLVPFIEENHAEIRVSDKLKAKIEKHTTIAKSLMEYYKIDKKLSSPLVEYTRYVLTSGTESEKTAFADGVQTKISIQNSELHLNQ